MKNHLIPFDNIPWEYPKNGVEQKYISEGSITMRLLVFRDNFIEEDWCTKGHIGYVLEGEMSINFGDISTQYYKKGDGLIINNGEKSKHKAVIEKGEYVKMILFED